MSMHSPDASVPNVNQQFGTCFRAQCHSSYTLYFCPKLIDWLLITIAIIMDW